MKKLRASGLGVLLSVLSGTLILATGESVSARHLAELLPSPPECDYLCDTCGSNLHTLSRSGILEPEYSGFHEEWCEGGGCAVHECGGVTWVEPFERAYFAASLDVIREFVRQNPKRVTLNAERYALQLLGCDDRVLASYPLPRAD